MTLMKDGNWRRDTTLHYWTAWHYTALLNCVTLHCTTELRDTTLHYWTAWHYTALLNCVTLHCTTELRDTTLHYWTVWHYTALLNCVTLHCTIELRDTTLHYWTAWHYTALLNCVKDKDMKWGPNYSHISGLRRAIKQKQFDVVIIQTNVRKKLTT